MSERSLEEVKRTLSRRYLGKAGVHGLGIRRSENAICIYVDREAAETSRTLEALRADAAPFKVIEVREERAKAR